MERHYHILNGDSLKEQFPAELDGQIIIVRECLVDGEVKSKNLDDFFQVRAHFIADYSGDYSIERYFIDTVSEFEKIRGIPQQSAVNLWFEDDLFCQVNFWFVVYLLYNAIKDCKIFLIRPTTHTQFGFGGLNKSELLQIYKEKIRLIKTEKIASLWRSYQDNDTEKLIKTAKELKESYPFILQAVEAHIARIPTDNKPGRPVQSLKKIMNELKTLEFEPVFREFTRRESIYGFGDLQVKRLFDKIQINADN